MRIKDTMLRIVWRHAYVICCLLALPGCIDEISLDLPDNNNEQIVIEGNLIKQEEAISVTITVGTSAATRDFNRVSEPIPFSNAYLVVDGIEFPQYPLSNGFTNRFPISIFEPEATITDGTKIQLKVLLLDQRVFESEPETIAAVPKMDSLSVNVLSRIEINSAGNPRELRFAEITVTTPLLDEQSNRALLKWEMEGVYRFLEGPPPIDDPFDFQKDCYVFQPLGNNLVSIFNGRKSTENQLIRYPVIEVPLDHKFALGYLITIFQQSISAEAFEYWDQVQLNNSQSGSLFDPVPGTIKTNIRNIDDPDDEVQGFFYVMQVDTLRRVIKPGEVGRPRGFCVFNENSDICQECTLLANSTTQRPPYWIE